MNDILIMLRCCGGMAILGSIALLIVVLVKTFKNKKAK